MSQAQIDRASQQLYEDMTIREDLTDDESQVLLDWAEQQIRRLAAQDMPDAAFDDAFSTLAKTLSRMGWLAAERDNMPPEDVQAGLERIEETAAQVGLVPAENTFLAQSAPGDVLGNVQALITYLSSGTATEDVPGVPSPDAPAQLAESPAEPSQIPAESPPAALPAPDEDSAESNSFFNRLASQLGEYLNGEEKPE